MAEKTQVAESKSNFGVALTEKLESLSNALPQGFNRARFVQNCLALLNTDADKFKGFKNEVIMAGIVRGSILGLDFFNKECYLVPYGSKLEFMTSYTGQMKLAKKYSARPIKEIYAKLICEGDEFEEVISNGEQTINFKPKFPHSDKIIGAFAVVSYKDGGINYEVMTLDELENTRKCSKASNSPAWKNFPGEMYKKTVIRRLCKYIDLEFESVEQQQEFNDDMSIETDPIAANEVVVEAEANTVDFVPLDGEIE